MSLLESASALAGLVCGETPDEQPIHAVGRVVRERDAAIARADRAEAQLAGCGRRS